MIWLRYRRFYLIDHQLFWTIEFDFFSILTVLRKIPSADYCFSFVMCFQSFDFWMWSVSWNTPVWKHMLTAMTLSATWRSCSVDVCMITRFWDSTMSSGWWYPAIFDLMCLIQIHSFKFDSWRRIGWCFRWEMDQVTHLGSISFFRVIVDLIFYARGWSLSGHAGNPMNFMQRNFLMGFLVSKFTSTRTPFMRSSAGRTSEFLQVKSSPKSTIDIFQYSISSENVCVRIISKRTERTLWIVWSLGCQNFKCCMWRTKEVLDVKTLSAACEERRKVMYSILTSFV